MKQLIVKLLIILITILIPLSVFIYTLSPNIAPGDSTEMATAAIVLGVTHQPSYPVNTLIGYAVSKLPLPMTTIERVNSASAMVQALTVGVFYFLILMMYKEVSKKKLTIGAHLVAFSSSMYLAFNLIYWNYATKFEVFPLNNLLVLLILYLSLHVAYLSGTGAKYLRKKQILLYILVFLVGFAFTHHQTVILIFPAVVFLLRKEIIRVFKKPKIIVNYIVILLVSLLPYVSLLMWIASRKPLLNWGEIESLDGVIKALIREDFGTFSSFLVGFEPSVRPAPIEQIWFYLKYMVFDFSILGFVLAILGIYYLLRKNREMLYYVILGNIVSGFLFLAYANFPLADSFNQATVRRFHMLPNIFIAILVSFGLYYLYSEVNKIKPKKKEYKIGLLSGKVFLILSFLFPLYMNYPKADHRGNTLTIDYLRQAYSSLPNNALVMLSGDIPNMTMDYYRMVELEGKDGRIAFSPGQFHLPWFTYKLVKDNPDLKVPLPKEGKYFTTATQVIEANYGSRQIYVGPDLVMHDPEMEEKYVLYPKHYLFLVKKKGEDLKLEEWREENDKLWEEIDLDMVRRIRKQTPMFEETIIFHYTRHFFNVGFVYEDVGLYEDAIREYERVLEIDPYFKEALAALARVYGDKMDPPDYYMAIDLLQKYQSVLRPGEGDFAYAALSKIYEYQQKIVEAQKEEEKLREIEEKMEATGSGEENAEEIVEGDSSG